MPSAISCTLFPGGTIPASCPHHLVARRAARSDTRDTAGHRLLEAVRETLAVGREHERVGRPEVRADIVDRTDERRRRRRAPPSATCACNASRDVLLGAEAPTDDEQANAVDPSAQRGDRIDETLDPFALAEEPGVEDDVLVVGEPESARARRRSSASDGAGTPTGRPASG